MNNIRSNKGITILSLLVTVVVLVILAGTAIKASVSFSGRTKFKNLETELLLIQNKCKVLADKQAIGEVEEKDLYGIKQTEGPYAGWYLLTEANLYDMDLRDLIKNVEKDTDGNTIDGYYVNYEDNNVAYGPGVAYEGKEYHKLSEIKEYVPHN
ncbi:MAG: hypothetical protein HFJ54_02255 [Clostridia bacterium]|nr:hypothetical protein [Clostridia bacterium]